MPEGTFYNKISANHTTQFTQKELNQLCNVLIEMGTELSAVESADFNEGLKILTNTNL